jgi:hypothetical protein
MATAQLLVLPSSMGGPFTSHRTTATYAARAVQSMPLAMTPARRRRLELLPVNGSTTHWHSSPGPSTSQRATSDGGSSLSSWESAGTAVDTDDRAMLEY